MLLRTLVDRLDPPADLRTPAQKAVEEARDTLAQAHAALSRAMEMLKAEHQAQVSQAVFHHTSAQAAAQTAQSMAILGQGLEAMYAEITKMLTPPTPESLPEQVPANVTPIRPAPPDADA
jgi:hypothetical protein